MNPSTPDSVYDAAAALLKKLEEVTTSRDFKTCMAISEAQGFPYRGPWILEEARALAIALREYQPKAYQTPSGSRLAGLPPTDSPRINTAVDDNSSSS